MSFEPIVPLLRPSFFLFPSEDSKSKTIRRYALKYLKDLEIDSQFVSQNKAKRQYLKMISSCKIKANKHFEQSFSFKILKRQKKFASLESSHGENVPFLSKLVKTKRIEKLSCPKIYIEKGFLRTFATSSSFRKKLTQLGIALKNENHDLDEKFLVQLNKCQALASLSLYCFGSANPFRQKDMSHNLNIRTLQSLTITVLYMGHNLLANVTKILSSNPLLNELSISAVEWKLTEKNKGYEEFLSSLKKTKTMTSLKLSNLFLGTSYKNLLLESISQLTNLNKLSLGISTFSQAQDKSFENMCLTLINLNSLTLEFDSVYIGPDFFRWLSFLINLNEFHFKANFEESLEPCLPEAQNFFKTHPWLEKFSFIVYQTPRLEEESFNKLVSMLMWCPKINFLDIRIRKFSRKRLNVTAFESLSQSLMDFRDMENLTLNFHLWYPVKCDLEKIAQSLGGLKRMRKLILNLPMIKEECTETILTFCKNIAGLKELRTLKLEFCLDEPIDLEAQIFDYLLDRLPKLEELTLLYHNIGKINDGSILPYQHLEKKAKEKYKLLNFVLSNVLIYTYGQASEDKGKMLG